MMVNKSVIPSGIAKVKAALAPVHTSHPPNHMRNGSQLIHRTGKRTEAPAAAFLDATREHNAKAGAGADRHRRHNDGHAVERRRDEAYHSGKERRTTIPQSVAARPTRDITGRHTDATAQPVIPTPRPLPLPFLTQPQLQSRSPRSTLDAPAVMAPVIVGHALDVVLARGVALRVAHVAQIRETRVRVCRQASCVRVCRRRRIRCVV